MSDLIVPAGGDIPSQINTVEKLIVWAGSLYGRLNPTLQITEAENVNAKIATWTIFPGFDGNYYFQCRLTVKISSDYASNPAKFWQNAQELTETVIPIGFKEN